MLSAETCRICARRDTQEAHVKPKRCFESNEDGRHHNIVLLCRTHHNDYLDQGKIGICPCKMKMVVEETPGKLGVVTLDQPLNIKDEYISFRNGLCKDRIRHALGLTHDSHRDICSD